MDLDWHYMQGIIPLYSKAFWLTMKIAWIAIVLSLFIGMICNFLIFYRIPIIHRVAKAYIALFRNTPLIIQLFFLFFALPSLGIKMAPEFSATLGLTLLGGSFMYEAFRGGIQAIQRTQLESGLALGLKPWQLMRYVILPQAISYSVPTLGANCIFMLKETSVFSVIAVVDLMNITKTQIGMFYKSNDTLLMLVIAYVIMLLPLSLILTWLERHVRNAEFGN